MFSLRAILCHLGALFTGMVSAAQPATRLYINYSRTPPPKALLAYDLCILDPHAKVDLKPGQKLGHHFLAYLSLVELAKGSPASADAHKRGVPLLGSNAAWASEIMDVTTETWRDFILEDVAAAAIAKGYDGFFLDTADSVAHTAIKDKGRARKAVIDLVRALHQRWPSKRILLNRGFDLLSDLAPVLNGVMVESVYQSFDSTTKHYQPVSEDGSRWVIAKIKEAQQRKLSVYAVDYVEPHDLKLANETVKRLIALDCIPLITTPALNGAVIAPLARKAEF